MSVGHNSLLKIDLRTLYMSMGAGESFKSLQKSAEEEYMLNGVLWSQAVGRGSGHLHPGNFFNFIPSEIIVKRRMITLPEKLLASSGSSFM